MNISQINYIIIHCSASPHRGDTAEDVHRWHKEKGWDGIGYHYVITEDGTIEAGRPLYWQGSHCRGYNDESWGICLLGEDMFTDVQITKLKALVNKLKQKAPQAKVVGHCDLDDSKSCPNFDVAEMFGGVL